MTCEWDWAGSEREFKRVLEINPNDGTARKWYGSYFQVMGRLEESIAENRRALEAEPLSLIISADLGITLFYARHYDQAIEQLRKTIDMDRNFVPAHRYLGLAYEQKAMFAEAIADFRQAPRDDPPFVSALGHAYAISGQRKMAEDSLARLKEQSKQRYVAPINIAVVYAGLKETDQTFKYLEMTYQDHSLAENRPARPGHPAAHAPHSLTMPRFRPSRNPRRATITSSEMVPKDG